MRTLTPGLTICQPYAELIMRGDKRVENRTWRTGYLGPLWIHAGLSREFVFGPWEFDDTLVYGCLVGLVSLVGCYHVSQLHGPECPVELAWARGHEHTEGPWCWILGSPRRLAQPIPLRGQPGLFGVPGRVVQGAMFLCGSCRGA